MFIFFKKFAVKPNQIGFVYRKNIYARKLEAGIYYFFDPFCTIEVFCLATTSKLLVITNQEVLSKDNIAFRFSYSFVYKITDPKKFLSTFELKRPIEYIIIEAEQHLHNITQVFIRNILAQYTSDTLNEQRVLLKIDHEKLSKETGEFGITIEKATIRDISFPKAIQDLFSKQLESKIRAQADLENARTTVATARALKNASELMKDDDNIKFFQFLETVHKIASKGKHTFMIGDFQHFQKEAIHHTSHDDTAKAKG